MVEQLEDTSNLEELLEEPAEITLPVFHVEDMYSLADEGYEQNIEAGLIAVATQQHIDDVLVNPWVEWNQELQMFVPNMYQRYWNEIHRQLFDFGTSERNEFTGMLTYTLKEPVSNITQIRWEYLLSIMDTVNMQMDADHDLAKTVRAISMCTRTNLQTLKKLYIGDYMALKLEIDRLRFIPSRNSLQTI